MRTDPAHSKNDISHPNRKSDPRSAYAGPDFDSSVQPEKACDKENDDDHADDVKNVHGVLRRRHRDFGMKSATSTEPMSHTRKRSACGVNDRPINR